MGKQIAILIFLSIISPLALSADYNGVDIDGNTLSCSAYSHDTASTYEVGADFDGDDVTITFSNGGSRTLTLDDDEIDDSSDISAYDSDNDIYWDLDCSDDLD